MSQRPLRLFLCIVLMLSIMPSPASAEASPTIELLGTRLDLGMTKSDAFAHYAAYKVQCVGSSNLPPECDSWIIQSRGAPYTFYANLYFKSGKLASIRKYWDRGFEGTEPQKFVATLYSILAQYTGSGPTEMTVETKETHDNGVTQTEIFLRKGNRTAVVSTIHGARDANGLLIPLSVNAYEILE